MGEGVGVGVGRMARGGLCGCASGVRVPSHDCGWWLSSLGVKE
jgi:hypothetical protein